MKKLLLILMLILAVSLDIFSYNAGILPAKPIYTVLPLFFILFAITYHPVIVINLINTRTFIFLVFIFILSVVFAINSPANKEVILTEVVNSFISILLYICFYVVFVTSKPLDTRIFFFSAIFIITCGLIYDMFVGLNSANLNVRKGGFSGNPNIAAASLKFLGLCLLILMNKHKTTRNGLLIFVILGIFMTFSRSGLIGIVLIAVLMILNEWKAKFNFSALAFITSSFKVIAALFFIYFVLVFSAEYLQQEIPALNQGDAKDRVDLLLGKSESLGTNDDNNSYGRKNLTIMYTNEFMDEPLGHGTGYSADFDIKLQDTHNVFLKMGINYGFIGFILIMFFFITSLNNAIKTDNYFYFVFILVLFADGLTSHNIFFDRPLLISFALMDSLLHSNKNYKILKSISYEKQ